MTYYKDEFNIKKLDLKHQEDNYVQENNIEISNKEKELELLKIECADLLTDIKNRKIDLKMNMLHLTSYNLRVLEKPLMN